MNQENYCSLNVAQKLVDAGIVLETDAVWVKWYSRDYPSGEWRLMYRDLVQEEELSELLSAPSFAEIWRELLKLADNNEKIIVSWIQEMNDWQATGADVALLIVEVCSNIEKLAELLIWAKGQEVNHDRP